MSDIITRDELAALGLGNARPGEMERVEWPDESMAHALGLTPPEVTGFALALSLLGSGQLTFARVSSGLAESQGIVLHVLDTNHQIVRAVSRDPEVPLTVLVLPGRHTPRHHPAQDAGTVYVDLARGPCVLRATGSALAVAADPAGLVIQEIVEAPFGRPPVQRWAEDSGDGWLEREVARLAGQGGPWRDLVAAGVVARLAEPAPARPLALRAAEPLALGERLHAGAFRLVPVDPSVGPRRWVRGLDLRELQAIEAQAVDEADQLDQALRRFEMRLEPDVAAWRDEWLSLCYRRDDLEGVLVLLREAGRGTPLAAALEPVDESGRRLRFHVPDEPFASDERARRVRLGDPRAWWGMPDPGDVL